MILSLPVKGGEEVTAESVLSLLHFLRWEHFEWPTRREKGVANLLSLRSSLPVGCGMAGLIVFEVLMAASRRAGACPRWAGWEASREFRVGPGPVGGHWEEV